MNLLFQKLKKNMGFLNDNIGLFRDLTVWENVEFFHRIYFPEAKKNIRNQNKRKEEGK